MTGIDAHGAQRRDGRGGGRGDGEHHGRAGKRDRIERLDAEQERPHRSRQQRGERETDRRAGADAARHRAGDHRDHLPRARAERHADAELLRPLTDGVRQHAEDARPSPAASPTAPKADTSTARKRGRAVASDGHARDRPRLAQRQTWNRPSPAPRARSAPAPPLAPGRRRPAATTPTTRSARSAHRAAASGRLRRRALDLTHHADDLPQHEPRRTERHRRHLDARAERLAVPRYRRTNASLTMHTGAPLAASSDEKRSPAHDCHAEGVEVRRAHHVIRGDVGAGRPGAAARRRRGPFCPNHPPSSGTRVAPRHAAHLGLARQLALERSAGTAGWRPRPDSERRRTSQETAD